MTALEEVLNRKIDDDYFPHYRGVFYLMSTIAHFIEVIQYDQESNGGGRRS